MLSPSGSNAALCFICQQDEDRESLAKLKSKGLNSLIKYSKSRACDEMKEHLVKQADQEFPCVLVHKNCKRDFTNPLRNTSSSMQINETNEIFTLSLRSEDSNEIFGKRIAFFVENSLSMTESIQIGPRSTSTLKNYRL